MKRIFTFDLIRACAIIGVTFVHTVQYNVANTIPMEDGTQKAGPMAHILFIRRTMAGGVLRRHGVGIGCDP